MKKTLILICSFILILLTLVSSKSWASSENYAPVDMSLKKTFFSEHRFAAETNETWIQDPKEVAMRFAAPESPAQYISSTYNGPNNVHIVIIRNTFDDSIRQVKTSVVLEKHGNIWYVASAGEMHTCRRGGILLLFDGRWGWHTKPCD